MRSLFLKIFIWFWVATALVTLTHLISGMLSGPDLRERFVTHRLAPLGSAMANKFERQGAEGASQFIEALDGPMNMRVYLFDEQGNEVTGHSVPPEIKRLEENPSSNPSASSVRRMIEPPGPPEFITANVTSASGRKYLFIAHLRRERGFRLIPDNKVRWGELIAGLFVAGILCYGLARNLSSPVVKLRAATRRLAAGDLGARVGPSLGKRRDELADMGRDFDLMAGQIQSLMTSQRRLLHDISHELRSPLARLGVALELARNGDADDTRWALDKIELEAERLNGMVGQVLTLARLENESAERNERVPLDLASLVDEVATDADFEARSRNRTVRITATEPCRTSGNPLLLRSAIENVVRNAVLYTADGTTVDIALRIEQTGPISEAVITVRDHGRGVPEASLGDIFRPFYRVGDARDRESGGSGLGLSITQRAVLLHGGIVSASNAPGGGLQVEIRIPVDVTEVRPIAVRLQTSAVPAQG
ncbi:MAG TPA: ATP-binding protein [Blastocatellia bacterium]|nr:ATP-binding protein [Blastocatellia bacterium]